MFGPRAKNHTIPATVFERIKMQRRITDNAITPETSVISTLSVSVDKRICFPLIQLEMSHLFNNGP